LRWENENIHAKCSQSHLFEIISENGSCPLTRFIKVTSYVQVVLKAIFTLFLFLVLFVLCVTWELGVVIGVT